MIAVSNDVMIIKARCNTIHVLTYMDVKKNEIRFSQFAPFKSVSFPAFQHQKSILTAILDLVDALNL